MRTPPPKKKFSEKSVKDLSVSFMAIGCTIGRFKRKKSKKEKKKNVKRSWSVGIQGCKKLPLINPKTNGVLKLSLRTLSITS